VATPMRTCVACRRRRPQRQLVRIARTPAGVAVDVSARLPGRGAYLCPSADCVRTAAQGGARKLRRGLRGGDADDVVAALARVPTGQDGTSKEPDAPALEKRER
jgi:predicted RNA-binding protein YlxR (DUF448 family)